jgi:AraC-like DNA-binding protein
MALLDGAVAAPPPDVPRPVQQRAAQHQARRQTLHAQVWALHRQGWTVRAIAQHIGLSERTVQRDLRTAPFLGRKRRSDDEARQLAHLRAQHAEVAKAVDLAQDFAHLVRQCQPAQLDLWLKRETTSALEAVRRFATGLRDDYEAVKAGVTLPWSTSPVEGHINRLKILKRQMLGQARLDLLSHPFLRAPRGGQAQAVGPPTPS